MTLDQPDVPVDGQAQLAGMLRQLRRRALLTQEELASRSGVSVSTIAGLESGRIRRPRSGSLRLLADALGLSPEQRLAIADSTRGGLVSTTPVDTLAHAEGDTDGAVLSSGGDQQLPDERPSAIPGQLPLDLLDFIGRTAELAQLDAILARERRDNGPVMISVIGGTAGVGKTALAIHWAHGVAGRFCDGQLYINLRGFDPRQPAVTPSQALRDFLTALNAPADRVPATLDGQAALYRSVVAGRKMLIVLDNARDAEQVRPLLPGAAGCVVVVTSRNQLTSLVATEQAHLVTLGLFKTQDARRMLTSRMGRSRAAADLRAGDDIIEMCARLPLALAIVAARAATNPDFPLSVLCEELHEARGRLDPFDGGDATIDMRSVLSWSYQILDVETARLFRLLGLHPGPDISAPAAASLAGIPVSVARRTLAKLVRANMLSEQQPGRFAFHDLLRAFAAELAESIDTPQDQRLAQHRLFDYYLHSVHSAALLLIGQKPRPILEAALPGVTPNHFTSYQPALAWYFAEHPVLAAVVEQSGAVGADSHYWRLAWMYSRISANRHLPLPDSFALQHAALETARRIDDRGGQSFMHRGLASACGRQQRYAEAEAHLHTALDLATELGNQHDVADMHLGFAWLRRAQGDFAGALRYADEALPLYIANDNQSGQADACNAIGICHLALGDTKACLSYCEEALAIFQKTGDRYNEGQVWDTLGSCHWQLGYYQQAQTCYHRAIELFRGQDGLHHEANSLIRLGELHQSFGRPDRARQLRQQSLRRLDEIDLPWASELRERLRCRDRENTPLSQRDLIRLW